MLGGVYLDHRLQRNEDEITALIDSTRRYDNVDRVMVGNETLLRGDMSVDALIAYIDRVRAQVKVPVSTAEPYWVWRKYPQLADHVDFVTIHLLPYWEKFAPQGRRRHRMSSRITTSCRASFPTSTS